MTHHCPVCDDGFDTRSGMRVHATKVHDRRLGHWYECEHCGEQFRDLEPGDRRFCSRTCSNKGRGDDLFETRECAFCGLELKTWPSEDTIRHQVCYHESRRKQPRPDDLRDLVRELYVDENRSVLESWRLARGHGCNPPRDEFRDQLDEWGIFEPRPSDVLESMDSDEIGGPTPKGDESWREFYETAD